MSDWKGISPIHSYSFRMGLEPEKSYSREGSGSLGMDVSCRLHLSNEKKVRLFSVYIGDEILPSYVGDYFRQP